MLLKMGSVKDSNNPYLLVFLSCIIPSLECELDLVSFFYQIRHGKKDEKLHLRLEGALGFHLVGTPMLSCPLACSDGARWHILICSMERSMWQEAERCLRPTFSEELNPAYSHMSEFRGRSSPSRSWR
jgi:hypothetical protein